jgi:hypothetical protein
MHFQSSITFASKTGAYLSEAPSKCSTLGLALGLTHKHSRRSPSATYFSCVRKRPSLLPPSPFYRRDARQRDEEGDEDDDGGEDLAGDPETAEEIAELVHQAGDDALEASHLDGKTH